MTDPKKIKILAVTVGAAIAVIVLDQVILLDPGDAEAAPGAAAQSAASIAPTAVDPDAASEPGHDRGPEMAGLLETVRQDHGLDADRVEDAFAPSPKWGNPSGDDPKVLSLPADSIEAMFDRFLQAHRVTAVIRLDHASGGCAVINNQIVRVGQELDGFRLVDVQHNLAVFERGGQRLTVSVTPTN